MRPERPFVSAQNFQISGTNYFLNHQIFSKNTTQYLSSKVKECMLLSCMQVCGIPLTHV